MATFFLPLLSLTLSGLPPERMAAASGLSNFVRITAGAIGASVVTTLWDNRSAMHHAYLTENISRYSSSTDAMVRSLMSGGLTNGQAFGYVERILDNQAHMLGAADVFWLSGVIFLVLMFGIWIARPEKVAASVDAGAAH
jgi:DHA2 family multidrug resistance protein